MFTKKNEKRIFARVGLLILLVIFILGSFDLKITRGASDNVELKLQIEEKDEYQILHANLIFPSDFFGNETFKEIPLHLPNVDEIKVKLPSGEIIPHIPQEEIFYLKFEKNDFPKQGESVTVSWEDSVELPEDWGNGYIQCEQLVPFSVRGSMDVHIEYPENYLILGYAPDFGVLTSNNSVKWEIDNSMDIKMFEFVYIRLSPGVENNQGNLERIRFEFHTDSDVVTSKKEINIRATIIMPKADKDFLLRVRINIPKTGGVISVYKLNDFNEDLSKDFSNSNVYTLARTEEDVEKNQRSFVVLEEKEEYATLLIHLEHSIELQDEYHYIIGIKAPIIIEIESRGSSYWPLTYDFIIGTETEMHDPEPRLPEKYDSSINKESIASYPSGYPEQEIKYVNLLYTLEPQNIEFEMHFPKNTYILGCDPPCEPPHGNKCNQGEDIHAEWRPLEKNEEIKYKFKVSIEFTDQMDVRDKLAFFSIILLPMNIFGVLILFRWENILEKKEVIGIFITFFVAIIVFLYSVIFIQYSKIFTTGVPIGINVLRWSMYLQIIICFFILMVAIRKKYFKMTKK